MRMGIYKPCRVCGKEIFVADSLAHRKKYCSRDCQKRGQSLDPSIPNRVAKNCKICNAPFTVQQSVSPLTDCCGRACADKSRSNNPDKVWTEFNCDNCGALTKRRTYRIQNNVNRFCSRLCRFAWATKQTPFFTRTVVCVMCGIEFTRTRYFVEVRGDAKCCSRKCLDQYNSLNRRREKNVNWNGGQGAKDYGPDWSQQNKLARKRDGNQCVLCHARSHPWKLDVHHIIRFKFFEYVPGVNENYIQANDLKNLIVLCKKCHRKVEKSPYILNWVNPFTANHLLER